MTSPVLPNNPRETWNRLVLILEEVVAALADACIPVDSWTIEPGLPAYSYCCEGGHAYVRLVRGHMVEPFPQQSTDPRSCINMGFLIEVGVLRCSSTMDANGNAPDPEVITAEAQLVTMDMSVIHNVLTQHNPAWANYPATLDIWEPVDPSGGCVGGYWQAWIDVAVCPPVCPD